MTHPVRRLAVAAALAQKPHAGGHTWAILQYLLGFRQLGWDVLVVDTLDSRWCTDAQGQRCEAAHSTQARFFHDLMERYGFGGRSVLVCDRHEYLGLSRAETLSFLSSSAMLVNVMGYLDDEALLRATGLRVFLDIDPGFPQTWRALGLHDALAGYDAYVTVGERIGEPDCHIPSCGLDWVRTPQPIVLDEWPVCPPVEGGAFTSVAPSFTPNFFNSGAGS